MGSQWNFTCMLMGRLRGNFCKILLTFTNDLDFKGHDPVNSHFGWYLNYCWDKAGPRWCLFRLYKVFPLGGHQSFSFSWGLEFKMADYWSMASVPNGLCSTTDLFNTCPVLRFERNSCVSNWTKDFFYGIYTFTEVDHHDLISLLLFILRSREAVKWYNTIEVTWLLFE